MVDTWRWTGPDPAAGVMAEELTAPRLLERAEQVSARLGS
jgi:hypothetical protein